MQPSTSTQPASKLKLARLKIVKENKMIIMYYVTKQLYIIIIWKPTLCRHVIKVKFPFIFAVRNWIMKRWKHWKRKAAFSLSFIQLNSTLCPLEVFVFQFKKFKLQSEAFLSDFSSTSNHYFNPNWRKKTGTFWFWDSRLDFGAQTDDILSCHGAFVWEWELVQYFLFNWTYK